MVLDTARPKYKENTIWPGTRGRDAARKSTRKVNILQVFTIDFSEIQFIVNHISQSDGHNKSAKSGMNLHKKTIRIISLQRKRKDTNRFSEIQFIVNHNSQSDEQNKSAKRWYEPAQEDHTYHLSPEEQRRYQGQSGQAKMGL